LTVYWVNKSFEIRRKPVCIINCNNVITINRSLIFICSKNIWKRSISIMDNVRIPDKEYGERVKKAARMAGEKGLDIFLVNSNEADYANVRYFSGFWPLFERAGVAIAPESGAALIVGPESKLFAADVSRISKIFVSLYYCESADPSYPEFKSSTYRDVFAALGVKGDKIRIGIGSLLDTNAVMMEGLLKHLHPCVTEL
jgi:hypothetical protein